MNQLKDSATTTKFQSDHKEIEEIEQPEVEGPSVDGRIHRVDVI